MDDVKPDNVKPIDKEELIKMLDEQVAAIERLPAHAQMCSITHSDFSALMMLLSAIFKRI